VKPELLKSWNLEIDYSRALFLGAVQKTRGLWERDWPEPASRVAQKAAQYVFPL